MKKNICPICGVEVFVSNEETTICENCFTKLDNELILKTDKLKLDKFNVNLYALNCQYHKILETKACVFRKLCKLFFFEKKSCKKRQKASPALAAFCAQGRTK